MSLTDAEEREMYTKTLKTDWTIDLIKERLEKGDETLGSYGERIRKLEMDHIEIKGKIGWIVLVMSLCFTGILNAIGWVVSHFWK